MNNTVVRVHKRARIKQFHHKARTGCETCKRRRIKCDEGKPRCEKCLSIGSTDCVYNPPKALVFESNPGLALPWSTKKKSANETLANPQPHDIQPIYSNENEDRIYLDYFVNQLSIRYSGSKHQRMFWRELLPQASWHCEGVKYAMVVLSMVQRSRISNLSPFRNERCQTIVRRKHSQAISYLTQMPAQGSSKMMSIESLLFASIALWLADFISGHLDRSWIHLKASWRLIRQYTLLTSTVPSPKPSIPPNLIERVDQKLIIDTIGPLLEELMPHSCLMADSPGSGSVGNTKAGSQLGFFGTPFASIEVARKELFVCVNAIFDEHENVSRAIKSGEARQSPTANRLQRTSSQGDKTNGIPSLDIWIHRFSCSEACTPPSTKKTALERIFCAVRIARGVLMMAKPSNSSKSQYSHIDSTVMQNLLNTKCSLILAQILDIAALEGWSSQDPSRTYVSSHYPDVKRILQLVLEISTDSQTRESAQSLLLFGQQYNFDEGLAI